MSHVPQVHAVHNHDKHDDSEVMFTTHVRVEKRFQNPFKSQFEVNKTTKHSQN